jgi:hypothetical protein
MTRFSRTLFALSTMLVATAPAAAQGLRGTVVDQRSKPVDSVRVVVSAAAGGSVGFTLTGADGEFSVPLPMVGAYVVRASKPGYATLLTQPITVVPGLDASVQLRLAPAAVTLDTLTVVAQSVAVEQQMPYLAQVGFYARKHRGLGRFLTRADLDKTRSDRLSDALRGMPGVHIVCGGAQYCDVQAPAATTTFTRGVCQQTVVLDGVVLRNGGISGGGDPLDQLLNPFNLEGVEVYSSPSGVPVQFKGYMSPCGAIIAWSRR